LEGLFCHQKHGFKEGVMPRANRYFLKGHVWHITHRCHRREFLLKFAKDRQRWLYWLFEARKRFGLCVLNYMVTSNHIHLLVLYQRRGRDSAGYAENTFASLEYEIDVLCDNFARSKRSLKEV